MTQAGNRRQALRQMGALALGLGAADIAWGASIVAVRVWPAQEYTRVTIESDQALVARQFMTDNPPRLVVDIDNLELSSALRELVGKVRSDDPFIAGVRVGQNQPRVVRLVIDLKQPVVPQQLVLAPVAAYQHRLVFDLVPTEAHDPLLALINEREAAASQAERGIDDTLGAFIDRIEQPAPVSARPGAGLLRPPPPSSRAARAPTRRTPPYLPGSTRRWSHHVAQSSFRYRQAWRRVLVGFRARDSLCHAGAAPYP